MLRAQLGVTCEGGEVVSVRGTAFDHPQDLGHSRERTWFRAGLTRGNATIQLERLAGQLDAEFLIREPVRSP
jgi:hypothetical protein